jgi:glutamate racemase
MNEPQLFPSPLAGEGDAQRRERGNSPNPHILIFDSGMGGMSVYAEIAKACPHAKISYLADDAVFPYGALAENLLIARVMELMEDYIPKLIPDVVVIACNTASTLVLPPLRARFNVPFVGTVPAIKPAAERSKSKMFSVLATPGTVARDYTKELIRLHASDCDVTLVGAPNLARLAEEYLSHNPLLLPSPLAGAERLNLPSPLAGAERLNLPSPLAGEGDPKDRERGKNKLTIFRTSRSLSLSLLEGADGLNFPSLLAFERDPKDQEMGKNLDDLLTQIRAQILPAFIEKNNIRTDIVVLACTHYPLILPLLQQSAPWQVEWINPAEAIARRVMNL